MEDRRRQRERSEASKKRLVYPTKRHSRETNFGSLQPSPVDKYSTDASVVSIKINSDSYETGSDDPASSSSSSFGLVLPFAVAW